MYDRQTQNTIFVTQQQLDEQTRDKSFDRLAVIAVAVFVILFAAWAVDQALVQMQIWLGSSTAWLAETASMLAGYWPF
ncbi:hypothetical protein [Agrobacterium sp. LAD9]|uniref:hypothetical protein n=1 Tax=Agrobacterium sp. LAD9 TaxID=2055153 RepID=UPI000D1F8D3D|nr:hypothetical protein [Agrobacterium sp. LAD9]